MARFVDAWSKMRLHPANGRIAIMDIHDRLDLHHWPWPLRDSGVKLSPAAANHRRAPLFCAALAAKGTATFPRNEDLSQWRLNVPFR